MISQHPAQSTISRIFHKRALTRLPGLIRQHPAQPTISRMLHKPPVTHRNQHPAEFSLHKRASIKGVAHDLYFQQGAPGCFEAIAGAVSILRFRSCTRRTVIPELKTKKRPNTEPQGAPGCLETIIRQLFQFYESGPTRGGPLRYSNLKPKNVPIPSHRAPLDVSKPSFGSSFNFTISVLHQEAHNT